MRLIDADRLYRGLCDWKYGSFSTEGCVEFAILESVLDGIQRQPTIDAVPVVHGRWVKVNDDDSLYRCSACGELSCCNSPYCGECGAKMDEE